MSKLPYTKPGRLADVLALIQALALDEATHRSETGVTSELQAPPRSATKWFMLAEEHPEFFRVNPDKKHGLSLVARHVLPHSEDQPRPSLEPDFVSTLLQTAITLHDSQVRASDRSKYLIPFGSVILSGLLVVLSTFVTLRAVHPPQTGRFVKVDGFGVGILLDTASGQLCYAGIATGANAANQSLPSCTAIH